MSAEGAEAFKAFEAEGWSAGSSGGALDLSVAAKLASGAKR
jgi:hypothetical protein